MLRALWISLLAAAMALSATRSAAAEPAAPEQRPTYGVLYTAWIKAGEPWATVRIRLTRHPEWVRWMRFEIDPARYKGFKGEGSIAQEANTVLWKPPAEDAWIQYKVLLTSQRESGRYDGAITDTWALFRAEDLVPVKRIDFQDGTQSQAKLHLEVPEGWSIESAHPRYRGGRLKIDDPRGNFDRPTGWLLLGDLGVRREKIGNTRIAVGAPTGQGLRRMDIMAFFRWTLPTLQQIFPEFPERILVVGADDPMWRGALSGPGSLFVHSDRPMISENATSTFIHELVHVAMRARSGPQADWIVEGLAEYYSLEALHRSGTVSTARFEQAHRTLADWAAREAGPLDAPRSSGPTTARAVGVLRKVDAEIRAASGGRQSLDNVVADLAAQPKAVTLEMFRASTERHAGRVLASLQPAALNAPPAPP